MTTDPKAQSQIRCDAARAALRREQAVEELLLLRLANEDPAFGPFRFLFDEALLAHGILQYAVTALAVAVMITGVIKLARSPFVTGGDDDGVKFVVAGTTYRVRISNFATREEAAAFGEKLS